MINGMDGTANESGEAGDGEMNEGERAEMDMDEVMRLAREIKIPQMPTVEEYMKHKLTHTPFKAWCPICVKGQAQNPPIFLQSSFL